MEIRFLLALPVLTSSVLCQNSPPPTIFDVIGSIFRSLSKVGNNELRDVEDCGKRSYTAPLKFNECLWDCNWRHNPFINDASPFFWVDPKVPTLEKPYTSITTYITTPKVPQDLSCLSDCFSSSKEFTVCVTFCSSASDPAECLFKCYRESRELYGALIASDFSDMAMEFCRIAATPRAMAMNLFPKGDCSTFPLLGFNVNPFLGNGKKKHNLHKINKASNVAKPKQIGNETESNRLFGASTFPILPHSYPWMCSLRTRGYRGRHRCGVTLLSGPTEAAPGPVVLVGAAHCNYICKERESGNVYETCCCRPEGSPGSCKTISSYCRGDPIFTLAEADDLQIVCGEFSVESPQPELVSGEREAVLDIKKIINHPDYQPNGDSGVGGPIEGNDICVYIVDESGMSMEKGVIWPACLPKEEYPPQNKAIFAGWQAATETFQESCTLDCFRFRYWYPKQKQLEEVLCRDPAWMNSNTYYPPASVCYQDPSYASCVDFGNSGSGILRKWRTDEVDNEDQYSFIGPLSISKGCDRAIFLGIGFQYRGDNPSVATDAICFLDWIAEQYDLKLPQGFHKKASCSKSRGNRSDKNKRVCRTNFGTYCDFSYVSSDGQKFDTCRLWQPAEGIANNVNGCVDAVVNGVARIANCANNCVGVDPNAIIGAGVAAFTATGLGAIGFLGPMLGAGALGAGAVSAAAGGAMLTRAATCPPLRCRVGNRCCLLVSVNGRIQCPSRC